MRPWPTVAAARTAAMSTSFYLWETKEAMELFMASPAIAKVAGEPFLKHLSITAIPVVEDASRITRGV